MIKNSPGAVSGWTCPRCSNAPHLVLSEGEEAGEFWGCPNKECMYTMPCYPGEHNVSAEEEDEGFSVYCSVCGVEISNGESAYAVTTGTIEEECFGFRTDDKPWLTVACEECGVKITEAICNIYPDTHKKGGN